jgi:tripartite-type tricarboxylate transporter receptor subunit TctC
MMIDVMPNVLPMTRSGKLRALAVSTARRSAAAPEYPTIAESGLSGFEVSAWDGVLAPAGTPPAIIGRLNAAIREALADPQLRDALIARGAQPVAGMPEEFARHISAETEKWANVVRKSGARVD